MKGDLHRVTLELHEREAKVCRRRARAHALNAAAPSPAWRLHAQHGAQHGAPAHTHSTHTHARPLPPCARPPAPARQVERLEAKFELLTSKGRGAGDGGGEQHSQAYYVVKVPPPSPPRLKACFWHVLWARAVGSQAADARGA